MATYDGGQYPQYTGGDGTVRTPRYTGTGGSSMASKGGMGVPQNTKPHVVAGRVNGARKPNGGLGMSSSKQSR